jgi:hypothetical protein
VSATAVVLSALAADLVARVAAASAAAPHEASLRAVIEKDLGVAAAALGIPWSEHTLDATLRGATSGTPRFVDAAHGALVIEYEPPRSFRGGKTAAVVTHAQAQAEENAQLLAAEEGRPPGEYVLVAWDGDHISFGRLGEDRRAQWEPVVAFDLLSAERLLGTIRDNGIPLVFPSLLGELVGPESPIGRDLLPLLYNAIRATTAAGATTKTLLLYTEWIRLFGQVVGIADAGLRELLERQGNAHGTDYTADPQAYLFALNTHIALVAKMAAALSLSTAADLQDRRVPIADRIKRLESGTAFSDAGVSNMLSGQDFFSWYADDAAWPSFAPALDRMLAQLSIVSFDIRRKTPESLRDLFKGLYMSFAPRELRHALGEFYTPDWLAEHVLDRCGWQPTDDLLDPTCGSGTFILEGLRRRLHDPAFAEADAATILGGIYGLDLNPLAVLSTRASLVVFLADRLSSDHPVRLPVFLADAINVSVEQGDFFEHRIQTERGVRDFRVPAHLVRSADFFSVFARMRDLVDAGLDESSIYAALEETYGFDDWCDKDAATLLGSISTLVSLHRDGWNGIWASILADRFAAGAIPRLSHVIGNPPWVKWSHLPPDYREFIKPICDTLGVFSEDAWVGGIEADISTVITYTAADRWLADGGTLAFLITGSLFLNESSQGFRRFILPGSPPIPLKIEWLEDFKAIAPFENVSNHTVLFAFKRGEATRYPIPYTQWIPAVKDGRRRAPILSAADFRSKATRVDLLAEPVPGTDCGPWLRGNAAQHALWRHLFGNVGQPAYQARKGITTDANGLFFLLPKSAPRDVTTGRRIDRLVRVEIDPNEGKRPLAHFAGDVDDKHLFALLRGRGVARFSAVPDQTHAVLLPQRGMNADPDLPTVAPKTFTYLSGYESLLDGRSSRKRFQPKQPYWALWTVGDYTFAPYKVAWREMPGNAFCAAMVGTAKIPLLGDRMVIPDHKVYFVPCQSRAEAAYLTAVLNAPAVAGAVSAYASALSLGVSVVEYLRLPKFDPKVMAHRSLAALGLTITRRIARGGAATETNDESLDALVRVIFDIDATV